MFALGGLKRDRLFVEIKPELNCVAKISGIEWGMHKTFYKEKQHWKQPKSQKKTNS